MGKYIQSNIGDKHNDLVIRSMPFKKYHEYWITCECKCGKIKDIRKRDVLKNRSRSCGCLQKEFASKLSTSQRQLSGQQSAFNNLYARYKRQAKDRKLIFYLTKSQFKKITSNSCKYCGSLPTNTSNSKNQLTGTYMYNGLDRVNNNLGYVMNNVAACCKTCNYMKHIMSVEEFTDHCKRIVNYFSR